MSIKKDSAWLAEISAAIGSVTFSEPNPKCPDKIKRVIRRVQADALRHAAKHVFETPHDCGQCCDDLEKEADALDPKESA